MENREVPVVAVELYIIYNTADQVIESVQPYSSETDVNRCTKIKIAIQTWDLSPQVGGRGILSVKGMSGADALRG